MAAPGATPIILYHTTTASAQPSTANLAVGELGVNVTDKKVYSKDGGGALITLVGTLGNQDASAVAITGGTINATTIGAVSASTGRFSDLTDTGLTSGRVTYASTGGNLVDSANLTFNGTTLTAAGFSGPIGAASASTGAFTTLSASDVATFSAGTVSAPAITTTGDTNTGIFFPAADTIAFTEGGTEAMRITSAGNVGIGTSSPTRKLYVAGDATIQNTLSSTFFNVNSATALLNIITSDSDYATFSSSGTGLGFGFSFGAGTAVFDNATGRVGINTVSPDATLSVNGAASFADGSAAAPSITNIGDLNTGMFFPLADTIAFAEGGTEAMRINSSGQIAASTSGTAAAPVITRSTDTNTGMFFPAADTIAFSEGGAEAMRITSAGDVGIGTSAPDVRLDVTGGNATVRGDGTNAYLSLRTTFTSGFLAYFGGSSQFEINNAVAGPILLVNNGVTRLAVGATGGVSIGASAADPGNNNLKVFGSIRGGYVALADGSTAMGFADYNVVRVTPTATATYTTTVPGAGAICVLSILTSGTTSRTITFGTGFKSTGTLATGTVTARYFNITFVSDGTNLIEMSRTVAIA